MSELFGDWILSCCATCRSPKTLLSVRLRVAWIKALVYMDSLISMLVCRGGSHIAQVNQDWSP